MTNVKKIARLADRYELKISLAQTQGAQAGDIETALKSAGLWVASDQIAPMLTTAKVPEDVAVSVSVVVDKGLAVRFQVQTTPNSPTGATLAKLLERAYSAKMSKALKDAQLSVADTVTAKLANFA